MVSLQHAQTANYSKILAVILTAATIICMVVTLVYCVLCQKLWAKVVSWRMKSAGFDVSVYKKALPKFNIIPPKSHSPALSSKQTVSIQPITPETRSRSPSPRFERKGSRPKRKARENEGKIQVHLMYYPNRMLLNVTIVQAQDLTPKDINGFSDPYCCVMILPDSESRKKTKVIKKELDPVWNETLHFNISKSDIQNQILYLYVLDHDVFNRDDFIGVGKLALQEYELTRGKTLWAELMPCQQFASKLGDILLSLCYMPAQEKLMVNVLKARNLPAMDLNKSSDPYVKIWRIYNGKKQEKRKTQIVKKSLNPVFNESFCFNIPMVSISECCLLVTVMDYDVITANDVIGHVLLGKQGGPIEAQHWKEMKENPQQASARWYSIQKDIPFAHFS